MNLIKIILFIIVFVLVIATALATAAPWVPTRKRDLKRILDLIKIKQGEKFFDLGCGDGRLIIEAAKNGAVAVGLDISPLPYFLTRIRLFFSHSNAKIKLKNLFNQNLSEADVVYMFLMPTAILKVKEKFKKELKKGTRVASYVFPIPGWTPTVVDKPPGDVSIYVYIV